MQRKRETNDEPNHKFPEPNLLPETNDEPNNKFLEKKEKKKRKEKERRSKK